MARARRRAKAEQQQIIKEMLSLAHFLASQVMPLRDVTQAVRQLRDDMKSVYRQGLELHIVKESYLPQKENS